MRNLYVKVWIALVAAVFVSLVGGAITARTIGPPRAPIEPALRAFTIGLAQDLPDRPAEMAAHLQALSEQHHAVVNLYDADLTLIAEAGGPLPAPMRDGDHWVRSTEGAGLAVQLDDGRWMIVGHQHPSPTQIALHISPVLGVIFAILAVLAWPIARMTTHRLEELRGAVEDLGQGDLSARVPVRGADEVAQLATSFNASAERIEHLLEGQRRVLASASHELRSPLTRIRMAAELATEADADEQGRLLTEIDTNVQELDALIADILLASRLDAGAALPPEDEVDLGILARQEAERVGAEVTGQGVAIAEVRMLRRLLRNLLENALKYGQKPIQVQVDDGLLVVSDAGPGIPESEREAVFEPFYRPQGHKESDGGVGLGLSLVKRIADHHGANVDIGAAELGGTRITVRWAQ